MSFYFKREVTAPPPPASPSPPPPSQLVLGNPNPSSLGFTTGGETQNATFTTTGNVTETFSVSNNNSSQFSVSPTAGTVINNAGIILAVTTAENIDGLMGNVAGGVASANITVTLSGGSAKTLFVTYDPNGLSSGGSTGPGGSTPTGGGGTGGGTETAPPSGPGGPGSSGDIPTP